MEKPNFPDYSDEIQQIRVMWNKARNMYSTAFVLLEKIRNELGDEQFHLWCVHELEISASILSRVSGVLKDDDRARVQEELRRATEIEREKKQQQKKEEEERKYAETMEKEKAKLERVKQLRIIAEETKKEVEATKKVEQQTATIRARPTRVRTSRGSGGSGGSTRTTSKPAAGSGNGSVEIQADPAIAIVLGIVIDFSKKLEELKTLRPQWVEASIVLATKLHEGKQKYPATQHFSKWLEVNDLKQLRRDEREVLIQMGADPIAAAQAFDNNPSSMSWQLVWKGRVRNATDSVISEQDQGVSEVPHDLSVDQITPTVLWRQ